eukprot:scaffold137761_cov35-Tisochrysis_lutea.AAC.1
MRASRSARRSSSYLPVLWLELEPAFHLRRSNCLRSSSDHVPPGGVWGDLIGAGLSQVRGGGVPEHEEPSEGTRSTRFFLPIPWSHATV